LIKNSFLKPGKLLALGIVLAGSGMLLKVGFLSTIGWFVTLVSGVWVLAVRKAEF